MNPQRKFIRTLFFQKESPASCLIIHYDFVPSISLPCSNVASSLVCVPFTNAVIVAHKIVYSTWNMVIHFWEHWLATFLSILHLPKSFAASVLLSMTNTSVITTARKGHSSDLSFFSVFTIEYDFPKPNIQFIYLRSTIVYQVIFRRTDRRTMSGLYV